MGIFETKTPIWALEGEERERRREEIIKQDQENRDQKRKSRKCVAKKGNWYEKRGHLRAVV